MTSLDPGFLTRACQLARQGAGSVEPNPQVGCVIVRDMEIVAEGWHQEFGGPHAEVNALADAGQLARGSDLYVTLEPCCHRGKTPPCTQALIEAGVSRVVVGCRDPNPLVAGHGIKALQAANLEVQLADDPECMQLIAPFRKLITTGRPWVIAKWAMTLDGKLATRAGSSQWISGEASRAVVHRLRGMVDAVLVGRGTAETDNPSLTARPPGPRTATRIVLDSRAALPPDCRLLAEISVAPVMIVCREDAPADRTAALSAAGAEVLRVSGGTREERVAELLHELGSRKKTNILVEGGSGVLGAFFDAQAIDEVHAFIATKLVGGQNALAPIAGQGLADMQSAWQLERVEIEHLEGDVHIHGFVYR